MVFFRVVSFICLGFVLGLFRVCLAEYNANSKSAPQERRKGDGQGRDDDLHQGWARQRVRVHRRQHCVRECEEVPPESTLQDDDRLNLRPGGIKTNVWQ